MNNKTIKIPNIFWKFFDLHRRKVISFEEFSRKTGLSYSDLKLFLSHLEQR